MLYVYILKSLSTSNCHYVGSCGSLEDRIKQHNKGNVKSTKNKRPLALIHQESFGTIREARQRENYLKSPKGYLEKKKLILENNISPG